MNELEYWEKRLEKAKQDAVELDHQKRILTGIKIGDCDDPEAVLQALVDNDWDYLEGLVNGN